MEQYEITRDGTLRCWAAMQDKRNAVGLLEPTLKEQSCTEESLCQIAEQANRTAEGA